VAALWEAVDPSGVVVGTAGQITADAPRWAAALYGFEVRITVGPREPVAYQALPTQPASVQDLSLTLPEGVSAMKVESVLRRTAGVGALLERLEVIDEYRGAGLPPGTRGVTWRCTFRDPARTLREAEVEAALAAMLAALEGDLGVRRRTG
jgi:phenylalanyl-tRNA synthetase beta chain